METGLFGTVWLGRGWFGETVVRGQGVWGKLWLDDRLVGGRMVGQDGWGRVDRRHGGLGVRVVWERIGCFGDNLVG